MKNYTKYSYDRGPGPFYKLCLVLILLISLSGLIYLGKDLLINLQLAQKFIASHLGKHLVAEKAPPVKLKVKPSTPKVEETIESKTKFDFYTLLPKMKMSSTIEESPAFQKGSHFAAVRSSENFVLQIASVQSLSAANELITRLKAMGIEAQAQSIQTNGKMWIRITSKPYGRFEEAQAAQENLHRHHIESLLMKTKN